MIKHKLYKPTNLSEKLLGFYDSPSNMSNQQAKKIFKHMSEESTVLGSDPGLRGRTSVAPLSKMGLVVSKKTVSKLHITDLGKKFLKKEFDMGEIFLEYFFKWTLPNPDSMDFSGKDGFNIRPFIATLHIIDKVNKKWMEMGNDPIGISKQEFCYFVLTTINYKDIPKTVEEIIKLRLKTKGKKKKEQDKIKKERFINKTKEFFEDPKGRHLEINFNNLKDYGDNAIRYFKITRFFYIRGGGFYIDLEPRRHIEIDSILRYSDGEGLKFRDLDEYLDYMDSDVIYPWESLDKMRKISLEIRKEIKELNKSLTKPLTLDKGLFDVDVEVSNLETLKLLVANLRNLRREVQEHINHLSLSDAGNFKDTIGRLKTIYGSDQSKSIELEHIITLCLHAINDALKIQPNYPVGDDNRPTFTAPANVPDIECIYESFNMICEVTMLISRDQWINEGQPVMRHLRDFETENNDNSFCLFIAPRIHRDTFNTFSFSNKYEYEGEKQRIIPLSISQFLKILNRVLIKMQENSPITHKEFRILLIKLHSIAVDSKNVDDWIRKSNNLLDKFENEGTLHGRTN